jgi:glycosyltransferase involved in cell wall biosynthesis
MQKERIAFILYDYPLGASSMIINSIKMFTEKGYQIDIYINYRNFDSSPVDLPNTHILIFNDKKIRILVKCYRYVFGLTGNLFTPVIKRISTDLSMILFFYDIYRFSKWLRKNLSERQYTFIIPVEHYSLFCLNRVKEKSRILYFNMELLDWGRQKSAVTKNKLIKKILEFREIQKISHTVVPSPLRKNIFSQINAVDRDKIHTLPVASMGPAIEKKSNFFRNRFSIPDSDRIVIYSGNFKQWAKCLEIIQSVRYWPKGYVLIMHTWSEDAIKKSYFQEMKNQAIGLPVYFSREYIDYTELASALSSADIGLAFYEEINENFSEILFSSNKIAEYLKAGLPLICSDFPSLKTFVERYRIGMALPVEKIVRGIEKIGDQLEYYRRNTLDCYEQTYRFELYFDHFFNDVKQNINET